MKHSWTAVIVAALMVTGMAGAHAAEVPAGWLGAWEAAEARANEQGRPLLAMFSASWCPPCQMMKRDVLPTSAVQNELTHWTKVYIDVDEQPEQARRHRIEAMPTFVMFTAGGEEFMRVRGASMEPEFRRLLATSRENLGQLQRLLERTRKSPDDPTAWKALGDLYERFDRIDDALDAYRRAARLDTNNETGVAADLAFYRALMTFDTQPEEALKQLELLVDKYPRSPRACESLFVRGVLFYNDDDHDSATRALRQFLDKCEKHRLTRRAQRMLERIEQEKRDG